MTNTEARHLVASTLITFESIRELLDKADASDALSTTCSGFTKSDVRRMILAAIRGQRGRVFSETGMSDFVVWAMVEFS